MTCTVVQTEMAEMDRRIQAGKSQEGVAYLTVLITVAILGISLAAAGTLWETASRRDKEAELLFVGEQYRRAIQQYYEGSPGEKRYPQALEDLLLDSRYPGTRRYLRRLYRDPLAQHGKWGLIAAPEGGLMGVYSLAPGQSFKQGNFPRDLVRFEGQGLYSGWRFMHLPSSR